MIYPLVQTSGLSSTEYGEATASLVQLARSGVSVIDTVVCTTGLHASFRENGRVATEVIEQLLALTAQGEFASHSRCFLRSDTAHPYPGLIGDLQAEKNETALKHALERIYRSWSSDRARAARLSRQMSDAEGAVSVIIQPCYETVETLLTRVPETGERTNESNALDVPQDAVVPLTPEYTSLLFRIDEALRQPSKVLLPTGQLRVLAAKLQPISASAALACECDYYRAGLIDQLEFLMRIEPRSYLDTGKVEISTADALLVRGIGAAGAMATGRFYLEAKDVVRESARHPAEGVILVRREVGPEDIDGIRVSTGVLTLFGASSSHAAQACRSIGRVCVVGCSSLEIDYSTQEIVFPSGERMEEGNYVILNGQTGDVYFSSRPLTVSQAFQIPEAARDLVELLLDVLSEFDAPQRWESLSEEAQARVGLHNRYLRELGLKR